MRGKPKGKRRFPIEKTKELKAKGLTIRDIAKIIGWNAMTVSRKLANIEEEKDTPVEPKKRPTKPWDSRNNTWAPDIFRLESQHSGFVPRFVDPVNIERRQSEGYQMANAENWGEEPTEGTKLVRKGMVLMEMPEEIMEKKRAYFKRKTDLQNVHMQKKRVIQETQQISQQAHVDMGLHEE